MTLGRLTTKWWIFRSDLCSENGTTKNCQIIRVAAKLHNFVINVDNLNFIKVPDADFDTLQVEPLEEGPDGNNGYLPIPVGNIVSLGNDAKNGNRLKHIVECLSFEGLSRPDRNIDRNL